VKNKRVSICCFTDGFQKYAGESALVAIDVIRATTTAVTAVSMGRKCLVAPTLEAAFEIASRLPNALVGGEIGGDMPGGFDMTNSPAQLAARSDISRPLVLLSSTGTRLMHEIGHSDSAYVACFRNHRATMEYLAANHTSVVLIAAGTRGEFLEEDQMCCAWIADGLMECGFVEEDVTTRQLAARWRGAPADAFLASRSVDYLRRSGQLRDLSFILRHFGDVDTVCKLNGNEVTSVAVSAEV
jgi:2-phosphosulfolactate phosphatase